VTNDPSATNGRLRWANLLDRASLALFALLMGALGMTGAAAAIAFPTMKELGPTLGAYPLYFGTHWNLAAGEVMRRVFDVADGVTIAAGVAGALAMSLAFALRAKFHRPTLTQWMRVLLAIGLLGVIAYQAVWLRPAMNDELFAFINAAAIGDAPTADFHRENFAALHPTASRTLGTLFMLAFASTALGCWSRRDG
jgi:hypothetical protein